MGELLREFLKQTISNLQILQQEFFEKETLSEDFLRRFFRQLHTIKGTSRTFDLENLARLTHEVENLLQAVQNNQVPPGNETNVVFQKAFQHLLSLANDYQHRNETVFPQEFADELRKLLPTKNDKVEDLLQRQIPNKFLSQLSTQEKMNLSSALQQGKKFYLLEAVFKLAVFFDDFKHFKEIINQVGETIAVSSVAVEDPLEEIAFQIFYVTDASKSEIKKTVAPLRVKFVFENSPIVSNRANNLAGMMANLIADGEKTAQILDKKIIFETSLEVLQTSNEHLILLNKIVSHLLHNSIDHGIETIQERIEQGKNQTAKIEISLLTVENTLFLQIKDDGKGIDFKKIIKLAKEKGLIPSDQSLDKKKAIELIFSPGFSTSQTISEISGRGVGLDAVKDLVEKAGGKIEVETSLGKGTTFSVYLPQN